MKMAPRVLGALVAALTDFGTYQLACKLLGPGAGPTAVRIFLHTSSPPSTSISAQDDDRH